MRVCLEPGCPRLVQSGRCPDHRARYEKARGTRQQRGYDAEHLAARAEWAPRVATGTVRCRRCRRLLDPREPWDLGHPDADCIAPRAPECRPCNRATTGRN